ncbi:MBL fold metallo-hydrolase [Sporosarcina psychrophila]|uniref:MBL fold metallo-hydrolase n=1 Tax=Sporosarcina psychrophila TaxID=1476 RepID=UPI0030D5C792
MKKYLLLFMALILAISLLPVQTNAASKELKVHFIDVGQGDSILIQAPNGKNMLVDGGSKGSGAKVVSFLKEKGVKSLDYVVATHPDADHIGGLIPVLNAFPVTNFVNSGKVHTTQTYVELLTLVDDQNINYIEPKKAEILIGNYTSDFYLQVLHVDSSAPESNDASIVIKTGYKKVDFLLMADADADIEDYLMYTYDDISADVLKAGHHGSGTSSSAAFISTVKPQTAILSYGKNNSYGHPNLAVESRLNKVGAKTYNTPLDCDITVTTDGVKHSVSSTCNNGKTVTTPVVKPVVEPAPKPAAKPTPIPAPTTQFKNCTELKKVYPSGVERGHPAYAKKHDRDGDGYACE